MFIYQSGKDSKLKIIIILNYDKIKNFSSNFNIKFIDIVKVLNREDNPLKYFPNQSFGHYTTDGYKLVANEILKNTE